MRGQIDDNFIFFLGYLILSLNGYIVTSATVNFELSLEMSWQSGRLFLFITSLSRSLIFYFIESSVKNIVLEVH